MKKFFKDYKELCKLTGKFYKEHWKGVIVMNLLSGTATMAYIYKDTIKENLKSKSLKD